MSSKQLPITETSSSQTSPTKLIWVYLKAIGMVARSLWISNCLTNPRRNFLSIFAELRLVITRLMVKTSCLQRSSENTRSLCRRPSWKSANRTSWLCLYWTSTEKTAAVCTHSSMVKTGSSIFIHSLSQTTATWCSLASSSQALKQLLLWEPRHHRTGLLCLMRLRSKMMLLLLGNNSFKRRCLFWLPRLQIIQSLRYREQRVLYSLSRSRHRLIYMP